MSNLETILIIIMFAVGWYFLEGAAWIEYCYPRTKLNKKMIGKEATIIDWNETSGNVRYEGEIWKAESNEELSVKAKTKVTITEVNKLILTIKKDT